MSIVCGHQESNRNTFYLYSNEVAAEQTATPNSEESHQVLPKDALSRKKYSVEVGLPKANVGWPIPQEIYLS